MAKNKSKNKEKAVVATTTTQAATKNPVEALASNHPAVKLEAEIARLTKIKTVDNGYGYWVGNTRILKIGKALPRDNFLFPRPNVKDLVKNGKLEGTITTKNVAQIQVTDTNFKELLALVKTSISNALANDNTKAEKKAKAQAAAKETAAKEPAAKANTKTEAEVKATSAPSVEPKAVAA